MEKLLIDILAELGVKKSHIRVALARQKATGESLTVVLRDFGFLDSEGIAKAQALQQEVPYLDLRHLNIEAIQKLVASGLEVGEFKGYVPLELDAEGQVVTVAISEPSQLTVASTQFRKYRCVKPIFASERTIKHIYREYYSRSLQNLLQFIQKLDDNQTPLFSYLLLQHACNVGASDLQLHATQKVGVIRLKIDGVWNTLATIPLKIHGAVINRIAYLSNINDPDSTIELMKDGSIDVAQRDESEEKEIRGLLETHKFRIAIGIGRFGKTLTIRVLENEGEIVDESELPFDEDTDIKLKRYCSSGSGLILFTGPTGSGKTTTMYGLMKQIDPESTSVQTIEHPVEYQHGMWLQYEIKRNNEDEWMKVLRGILRNAPNVIMLGEVRDASTAKTAYAAATTGHLVLTTLHTDSAPMAIRKLADFGLDATDLSTQLHGILCVRLVRLLCPECNEPDQRNGINSELLDKLITLKLDHLHIRKASESGCPHCNFTGYVGRTQIYELLDLNQKTRELLETGYTISKLREIGIGPSKSLTACGLRLVSSGKTSFLELLRVLPREQ